MKNVEKILDFESQFIFENTICHIRPVRYADISTLRIWKNANRHFFHHKKIISKDEQECWFATFSKESAKQLFVCEMNQKLLACVGFKVKMDYRVELFNLICGDTSLLGLGFMSLFFSTIRSELTRKGIQEIDLEVLKNNERAIYWYGKQGFRQIGEEETFLKLLLKI